MATIDKELMDARFLRHLFEEHVRKQLKESLRPHLEYILETEINKAIASMQTSIESAYHMHNNEKLVRIILEDKRDKNA